MIASITFGTAIASSLIVISMEIGGRVSRELRAFGANILVEPEIEGMADLSGQRRYLRYEDIVRAKTIFWRHNIVGIAPFLETDAEITSNGKSEKVGLIGSWYYKELPLPGETGTFPVGIKTVSPWWSLSGKWSDSADNIVIGSSIASEFSVKPGDRIDVDGTPLKISGTLDSGGIEDRQIFMDLESLQRLKGAGGKISKVLVSALTAPMDTFAYRDPASMSKAEYEKWYCTGYVTSIAKQIEDVFKGSKARPIWQVAGTEGKVLKRLKVLVYLLCLMTLAASTLGVSTTMIMGLVQRKEEIGLMKALGAGSEKIALIFVTEGIMIGLAGGLFGYLLSVGASQYIGTKVFGIALEQRAMLLPMTMAGAACVSIAGTVLPIKKAMEVRSAVILKGEQ